MSVEEVIYYQVSSPTLFILKGLTYDSVAVSVEVVFCYQVSNPTLFF